MVYSMIVGLTLGRLGDKMKKRNYRFAGRLGRNVVSRAAPPSN